MGNVYVGRHRKKGTKVAIKVFNTGLERHVSKEIAIFQNIVPHANLVNCIAVETLGSSSSRVLVMELCQGSVQGLLDKEENFFGLSESDVMRVYGDVTAGLDHLHKNKLLFRDCKPANVMRCMLPDGTHCHKLIDFGTCHDFKDNEDDTFQSLCGTEEYLSEHVHKAAFIQRIPRTNGFDASVDSWGLAVTIYQCLSGELPFRPKLGIRQDRPKMQMLLSDREPEIISQVEEEDGTISRRAHVPRETSRLGFAARHELEKSLRLMYDSATCIPRLFSAIQQFSSRVAVDIYCVERMDMLTVYVDYDEKEPISPSLHMIARVISSVIDIRWDRLVFMCENKGFLKGNAVDLGEPLYVSTKDGGIERVWQPSLIALPKSYETGSNVRPDSDAKFSRSWTGTSFHYSRQIQKIGTCMRSMKGVDKSYIAELRDVCKELQVCLVRLSGKLSEGQTLYAIAKNRMARSAIDHLSAITTRYRQVEDDYAVLWMNITSRSQVLMENPCAPNRCEERAEVLTQSVSELNELILCNKNRDMDHNAMEIHRYNRSFLKGQVKSLRALLVDHCSVHLQRMYGVHMSRKKNDEEILAVIRRQTKTCNKLDESVYHMKQIVSKMLIDV